MKFYNAKMPQYTDSTASYEIADSKLANHLISTYIFRVYSGS